MGSEYRRESLLQSRVETVSCYEYTYRSGGGPVMVPGDATQRTAEGDE